MSRPALVVGLCGGRLDASGGGLEGQRDVFEWTHMVVWMFQSNITVGAPDVHTPNDLSGAMKGLPRGMGSAVGGGVLHSD